MPGPYANRQKPAPPRLSRDSFEFDNPHFEHVEVSPGLESSAPQPGQFGMPNSKVTGLANITSPPRALTNARAALQRLAKSPGNKQPQGLQRPPASSVSQEAPVSQPAHGVSNTHSSMDAAADPPNSIPFDPVYMTLNISFGHDMPAPRWILERKFPRQAQAKVNQGVPPTSGELKLEWVFDAGPLAPFMTSRGNWLNEYAYKILETTLDDPIKRSRIRMDIWNRKDDDYTKVEDPIPPLPPPPDTLNVTQLDKGPTPGNRRERLFRYPGYERPSLARQCIVSPGSPVITDWALKGPNFRACEFDEEGANSTPSTSIDEYKWVWCIVISLVLGMFLCLFLYAFKIIL